jgi:hypothetical protein
LARPRIYVNRYGKNVKSPTGVHYNKTRPRFYVIQPNGSRHSRHETHTWEEARAFYLTMNAEATVPIQRGIPCAIVDGRVQMPWNLIRPGMLRAKAPDLPVGQAVLVMPEQPYTWARDEAAADPKAFSEKVGVALAPDRSTTTARGARLPQVIQAWDMIKREQTGATRQYREEIGRHWRRFVDRVGYLRIDELLPEHFRSWHSRLGTHAKQRSAKWYNDHCADIATVLRYVKGKYPEWPWPAALLEWAGSCDAKVHKPADPWIRCD